MSKNLQTCFENCHAIALKMKPKAFPLALGFKVDCLFCKSQIGNSLRFAGG